MNDKLFEIANKMEDLSIEIERIKNLVEILLNEHFDSKAKFENEHCVTYWVPYDNNFQTLTEVIHHLLSEQQMKSNKMFEQFCAIKDYFDKNILPSEKNYNSVVST